jgi:hypothetical protein
MTPDEATRAELGARILVAHFSGDQQTLEGTLQGVLGTLATLADCFTLVAISAGKMFADMAKVSLDVALGRLGDSDVRLLPVGDTNRRAGINLALGLAGEPAMTEHATPGFDLATMVNSTFGLAVDSVAAAAQGAETTPARLAQTIADAAHKGLAAGEL